MKNIFIVFTLLFGYFCAFAQLDDPNDNPTKSHLSVLVNGKKYFLKAGTNGQVVTSNGTSLEFTTLSGVGGDSLGVIQDSIVLLFASSLEISRCTIPFTSYDSGGGGTSTLATVGTNSDDAAKSLYTMTSTIPVEFESSDNNPVLYLDETNERIGVGTDSPSERIHLVSSTSGDGIGAGALYLGNYQGASNWGVIGSYSLIGSMLTDYAFLVSPTGAVNFNAPSGQSIAFKINGVNQMLVSSAGDIGFQLTAAASSGLHSRRGIRIGDASTNSTWLFPFTGTSSTGTTLTGKNLSFYNYETSATGNKHHFAFGGANLTPTSDTHDEVKIGRLFAPTSGTGVYNSLIIDPTINQTGGANGITRGLYIDATLTSASDFRAIETTGGDVVHAGKTASTETDVTLAAAATALAITSNVVTVTGDAGGNTLATITGGLSGQRLTLIFVDALVTITDTGATTANTVNLSASFTSTADDTLTLIFDGNKWFEAGRSLN